MPSLMRVGGFGSKLLRAPSGKLARTIKCCCPPCGCDPKLVGSLKAVFHNSSGFYEGMEVILAVDGPSWWRGVVTEWENLSGLYPTELWVRCTTNNSVNPYDPLIPCSAYVFTMYSPVNPISANIPVVECACNSFYLKTDERCFDYGGITHCFYWEVFEA